MTPWLRRIAEANPFTIVTDAARALYNGQDPGDAVWQSVAWAVGIIVVFSVVGVRQFTRMSR
jgi:ABC-type polysaccharide/polyol phosphate export permease